MKNLITHIIIIFSLIVTTPVMAKSPERGYDSEGRLTRFLDNPVYTVTKSKGETLQYSIPNPNEVMSGKRYKIKKSVRVPPGGYLIYNPNTEQNHPISIHRLNHFYKKIDCKTDCYILKQPPKIVTKK